MKLVTPNKKSSADSKPSAKINRTEARQLIAVDPASRETTNVVYHLVRLHPNNNTNNKHIEHYKHNKIKMMMMILRWVILIHNNQNLWYQSRKSYLKSSRFRQVDVEDIKSKLPGAVDPSAQQGLKIYAILKLYRMRNL